MFSASGLCPGRRRRHGPSDAQLAASSADVCPEVWGMQLDAMYPEIRPNPETSRRIGSRPPSEFVSKLASAGPELNSARPLGAVVGGEEEPSPRRIKGGGCGSQGCAGLVVRTNDDVRSDSGTS